MDLDSFLNKIHIYNTMDSNTMRSTCISIFFSLALHTDRTLVATGQIGDSLYICVWDSSTAETVSILTDGHTEGVGALSFEKDGNVYNRSGNHLFYFLTNPINTKH